MASSSTRDLALGKWGVFAAVSLAFFFLNLATFTSLGVVLYTMVGELHWSQTAAGFSFSFLGLACGLSSPLPAITMRRYGGRMTLCIGAALLTVGFFLSSISQSLFAFYVAMTFLGLGYSFAGNVPAVYLISGWFERGSSRIIGFYLMLGALGGAFGPPIVLAIVNGGAGWRGHWQVMAIAAAVIGVVCFVLVRDPKAKPAAAAPAVDNALAAGVRAKPGSATDWTPRQAIFSSQFLLIAAAMAATLFCVTTNNSIAVPHLVKLGSGAEAGAFVLSAISITATLVKALSGWLCEKIRPSHITAFGLALQAAGSIMLGFADTTPLQYASALIFGTGWGLSYVAGTVVLLDYFGGPLGSRILSVVWLLGSVAAAGPPTAGWIADTYGTFTPIFVIYGGMLALLALPIFLMRRPVGTAPTLAAPETGLMGKIETA